MTHANASLAELLASLPASERKTLIAKLTEAEAEALEYDWRGSRPFGYQPSPDGYLEPLETEQAAIQRMVTLRSDGLSLQAITSAIKNEFGFKLCHTAVKRVLRDE